MGQNKEMKKAENIIKDVFVARQPIFNTREQIFAYELLFRSGTNNFFDQLDGDYATSKVIVNSFSVLGLEAMTDNKRAFINFTRNLLVDEVATAFPKNSMVVEILENIEPDDEVLSAVKKLREKGYIIALDDFVFDKKYYPLIEHAHIIKVDFMQTKGRARYDIMKKIPIKSMRYLAEKVETKEEFEKAKEMGYSFFQGYFFSKPVIIQGRDIPGHKLTYLRLMREINRPDADFKDLANMIKSDVSITYKLLKFINSASFAFRTEITSIQHALTLMGLKELKKWLTLMAVSSMSDDKPEELIITSLIRAKFSEALSERTSLRDRSSDLFLMGLLSLVDAFLDQPLEKILEELPISDDIKNALLGGESEFKTIYDIVVSYEKGDWEVLSEAIDHFSLNEFEIPKIYYDSVKWTNQVMKSDL